MDIRADVWDRVLEFAVQLANEQRREKYWSCYNALRDYCEAQSLAGYDHPFLWETLADFTIDGSMAVPIYQRALDGSSGEKMRDFRVSIRFALAERYKAKGEDELAREYAIAADDEAKHRDDLELRRRISRFLLSRE